MTCTPNHLLIELGVSRRKEGREIMERRSQLAEAERLIDKLVAALEPFVALLQPHVEARAYRGDESPVFQIDNAVITVGDLRRARVVIKAAKS